MNALAAPPSTAEPTIRLLVADDDRLARSLLSSCARDTVEGIEVLEAEDGAEAIQIGLQRRPAVAFLDIDLPRLGGVGAAITLHELHPQMRIALQTADAVTHRERVDTHRLPLFSKLQLEQALAWLRAQVEWYVETQPEAGTPKLNLRCAGCGYGVLRSTPPQRCPMCHAEDAWLYAPPRASAALLTR